MKRITKALIAVTLAAGLGLSGAAAASAYSNHTEYRYPGGRYLQANVWLGNGQTFNWQTSTKYLGSGSGPSKATYIKNAVSIRVAGIGVHLGNFSGGTSSDQDFSAVWTNGNTWISDLAGANSVSSNFYLNITGGSSGNATIPYFGSPRSVATSVIKWS